MALTATRRPACPIISLIPREIRDQILSYLLAPEPAEVFWGHTRSRRCFLYPAILYTCKQLHLEGTQTLYGNLLIIDVCEAAKSDPSGTPLGRWCRKIKRHALMVKKIRLYGSLIKPVAPNDDLSLHNAILVGHAVIEVARYLRNLRTVEMQPTTGTFHIWAWGTDNNDFHGMKHYIWDSANAYPRSIWEMPMKLLFTKCRDLKGVTIVGVEGVSTLEEYESDDEGEDFINEEDLVDIKDLIEDEGLIEDEYPIKDEHPTEDRGMLEWLLFNCSREMALAASEWRRR